MRNTRHLVHRNLILTLILFLSVKAWANPNSGIPFSRNQTVVLLAPISDQTPQQSPAWLAGGLTSFIKDNLTQIQNLQVLNIKPLEANWLAKPELLRQHVWRDNFGIQPQNGYDIYIVAGNSSSL